MFGFGARCQDKLPPPAGPNHCLLGAWLTSFPGPRPGLAFPKASPATQWGGHRVAWWHLLLLGRDPEAGGCPVATGRPSPGCLLSDQGPGPGGS